MKIWDMNFHPELCEVVRVGLIPHDYILHEETLLLSDEYSLPPFEFVKQLWKHRHCNPINVMFKISQSHTVLKLPKKDQRMFTVGISVRWENSETLSSCVRLHHTTSPVPCSNVNNFHITWISNAWQHPESLRKHI